MNHIWGRPGAGAPLTQGDILNARKQKGRSTIYHLLFQKKKVPIFNILMGSDTLAASPIEFHFL